MRIEIWPVAQLVDAVASSKLFDLTPRVNILDRYSLANGFTALIFGPSIGGHFVCLVEKQARAIDLHAPRITMPRSVSEALFCSYIPTNANSSGADNENENGLQPGS